MPDWLEYKRNQNSASFLKNEKASESPPANAGAALFANKLAFAILYAPELQDILHIVTIV